MIHNMGRETRKLTEAAHRAKLEKRLIEAKKISSAIGLRVDWYKAWRCDSCLDGLTGIICQYKEKGAIFRALSETPESVFTTVTANCRGTRGTKASSTS
jgi:hypothetical protein